jgi:hypothetical protein
MPNDLAPIGVSTYVRLQHLQQTIAALQKNTLAQQSELFVFSDAPRPGDEERVAAVRRYLRTVDGFREVHIIERTENGRVANNRNGMRMLLDQYGRMIFLEEDVVTAPAFLSFMNQALTTYKNNDRVFAMTGYCPPIDAHLYVRSDAFLLPSCNYWGFAIWRERFDQVRVEIPTWEIFKTFGNPCSMASYINAGVDVPYMFLLDAQGVMDALDIKFSFEMLKKGSYVLVPTVSLSTNIGFDGSGAHCGTERKYDTVISKAMNGNFQLPKEPELNAVLLEKYKKFRSEGGGRTYSWLIRIYIQLARFALNKLGQKLVAMRAVMTKHE